MGVDGSVVSKTRGKVVYGLGDGNRGDEIKVVVIGEFVGDRYVTMTMAN